MSTYRSNGKLLLTAEYAVLDGAMALAVPTRQGQTLHIEKVNNSKDIHWQSFDETGQIWFEHTFETKALLSAPTSSFSSDIAARIIQILKVVHRLQPNLFTSTQGLKISTHLEFNRAWGLGSSSTLINNISNWADIDAFKLLQQTFGGSGYDVACAQNDKPIVYQLTTNDKPIVHQVDFNPAYSGHLYFVYLNQKQNSRDGIANYKKLSNINSAIIDEISAITKDMIQCNKLEDFNDLIRKHELIISSLIQQQPIQSKHFNDFDGELKSLGAWGGDFILASCINDPSSYFNSKGYQTVIPYDKMVLKQ